LPDNEKVEELEERALRHLCEHPSNSAVGQSHSCCESILSVLREHLPARTDLIPKMSTDIGTSVSLNGLLCGSVSSVVIAIGMKYGETSPEENPQAVWEMVDKYLSDFKDRFGHVNCRELTGLDMNADEGFKEYFDRIHEHACAARIRFAVKSALEILNI
jgi:C_GCAxxG_C_C family probable redox protein